MCYDVQIKAVQLLSQIDARVDRKIKISNEPASTEQTCSQKLRLILIDIQQLKSKVRL